MPQRQPIVTKVCHIYLKELREHYSLGSNRQRVIGLLIRPYTAKHASTTESEGRLQVMD